MELFKGVNYLVMLANLCPNSLVYLRKTKITGLRYYNKIYLLRAITVGYNLITF